MVTNSSCNLQSFPSNETFQQAFLSFRNSIICYFFSRLNTVVVTQKTIQTKEFLTITKMKRVGSIKQALKPSLKSSNSDVTNNNESSSKMQSSGVSILGNNSAVRQSNGKPDFHLPKSISSFLKKGSNTLTRNKKDKANQVSFSKIDIYGQWAF